MITRCIGEDNLVNKSYLNVYVVRGLCISNFFAETGNTHDKK